MADAHKYQAHEVLNKVLNAGEDGLNVDLADSVTVTVDSEFPAAAAITDNFANPTTTSAMSMLMGYDGSAWDRVTIGGGTEATALRVTIASDSTGVLSIDDNGGNISIDDGGNTITVDGTVSVSGLLADGHAVTIDNTDSNEVYVRGSGTAGSADDKVLTVQGIASGTALAVTESSPISGFATSANQSTIIGHVDGIETLITSTNSKIDTFDAVLDNILTKNTEIDAVLDTIKTDTGTIDSDTDAIKTATESSNTHLGNMFYDTVVSVTPHDTNPISAGPVTYYALWVGTGGNVKVTLAGSGTQTFNNVASGQLLPIVVTHVFSTNTTALNILALK